jgi:hypothetical protein
MPHDPCPAPARLPRSPFTVAIINRFNLAPPDGRTCLRIEIVF